MSQKVFVDSDRNSCSTAYWGSEEAAQAALDSLRGCSDCLDCRDCSGCSDCLHCSGCQRCESCVGCRNCRGCSGCLHCEGCVDCARCEDCSATGHLSAPPYVPVIKDLHAKIYAAVTQPKALNMNDWHTCRTTHCRAGWVIKLAGQAGKNLESFFGTSLAAMKIYDASCPGYQINPSRFYDSNEEALEDMKKLAGVL